MDAHDLTLALSGRWHGSYGLAKCPAHDGGRINFVVVRPPDGLSTKSVYQHHKPSTERRSVRPVIEQGVREGPAAVGRQLFNRLEPAASQLSPSINRLRDHFNRLDLLGHQMSGSGTCYFGICRHARQARRVAELLRARQIGSVYCAASVRADQDVLPWANQHQGEGL